MLNNIDCFDCIEIHPCLILLNESGNGIVEQCEPHEAEFWSVYGHLIGGGIECLKDFENYTEACIFATELEQRYPHLKTKGDIL